MRQAPGRCVWDAAHSDAPETTRSRKLDRNHHDGLVLGLAAPDILLDAADVGFVYLDDALEPVGGR